MQACWGGGGVSMQQGRSHPGVRGLALFSAARMAAANSGTIISTEGDRRRLRDCRKSSSTISGVFGRSALAGRVGGSSSSESSDDDDDELLDEEADDDDVDDEADDESDERFTTSGTAGVGSCSWSLVKSIISAAGDLADGRRGPKMAMGTTSWPTTTKCCVSRGWSLSAPLARPGSCVVGGRAAGVTTLGRG